MTITAAPLASSTTPRLSSVVAAAVIVAVFASCKTAKKVGGTIAGTIAEYTVCPLEVESIIECGHVFQCEGTLADTESGYIEICIDDDDHPEQLEAIEATFGMCSPTPRHVGLCSYCCGPTCGRGCNAFSGCYCPAP